VSILFQCEQGLNGSLDEGVTKWMKSYKVLNLQRVPKQGTIDHHEALRVLLFFICCVFCFCDVLLLASDEFLFYFFMVVMAINIDQTRILHYFGAYG
jgi:hypothetical protein